MNVEGMWAIYFGNIGAPGVNSGIIVLETGRMFGGDSIVAYTGDYAVAGGKVTVDARTWSYNPTLDGATSAFGKVAPFDVNMRFEGEFETGLIPNPRIKGYVWDVTEPGQRLGAVLVRICDLP